MAAFLEERIGFADIPRMVATALERTPAEPADALEAVLDADRRGREAVETALAGVRG